MPIEYSITAPGRDVDDLMNRIQANLADLTPAMNLTGEIVHGSIQENFEKGGRPTTWATLSPVTIAQRIRMKKWPGKTLIRLGVAGGLMGAVSYKAFKDRVELRAGKAYATTMNFGAKKGEFGTVEARIPEHDMRMTQMFGKKIEPITVRVKAHIRMMTLPWGNIPARQFMMVQDEDWNEITASLAELLIAARKGGMK